MTVPNPPATLIAQQADFPPEEPGGFGPHVFLRIPTPTGLLFFFFLIVIIVKQVYAPQFCLVTTKIWSDGH